MAKENSMTEHRNKKMIRLFLIGMLCGVMITAAFTYVFAIPANDFHWRMEIWNRGGAAWTYDKNGHAGWKWMVEPTSDTPRVKRAAVPTSPTNVRTEQL
jgi:cell division protein FtsN